MVATGLLLAGLGSGCVVSVGSDSGSSHGRPRPEVSKPPPVLPPPVAPEDAGVISEIDAATKLSFEGPRLEVLMKVATRPNLSPGCQVHLVNTGLRSLDYDASRTTLLNAVIKSPTFSPAGKDAILRQLEYLQFDASRQQIIGAIQERTASW